MDMFTLKQKNKKKGKFNITFMFDMENKLYKIKEMCPAEIPILNNKLLMLAWL